MTAQPADGRAQASAAIATTAAALSLESVGYAFPGEAPFLQDIQLSLAPGERHCLLGRSGCGKTTLLQLAAGLLEPTSGARRVDGQIRFDRRRIGFMFQQPTLLEWLRVMDNVLLPVSLVRTPQAADREAAYQLLVRLGLTGLEERYPRQLSGGQQSRVALARALLLEPPLLLLDEPFAALDALTREELQRDLRAECMQRGTTLLFVTHDIGEAVFLGERVSVMSVGRLYSTLDLGPATDRDTPEFTRHCAALRALLRTAMTSATPATPQPA